MVNILGINLSTDSRTQVLEKIRSFLNSAGQHYIVTPNPEIILLAHQDEEYFYILNQADLSLADGFGLKFAAALIGKKLPRLTGADLLPKIIELAAEIKLKVLVINPVDGLSSAANITAVLNKCNLESLVVNPETPDLIKVINNFQPEICLVTLGAPTQEKFIYYNLPKLPSIKLAIGIGGAFDFLTGKIKRAPKLMRWLGLEWLGRLISQPWSRKIWRLKRIYRAVVVFTGKVLHWRLIEPWVYRSNVAGLLYKTIGTDHYILLVQREDDKNHWQLPQGGTDHQSLVPAGMRELGEELNLSKDKFIFRRAYKNLSRYQFRDSVKKMVYNSSQSVSRSGRVLAGYKGQKQGLVIAEFLGQDNDIKINFWDHLAWKWVKAEDFTAAVHKLREPAARIFYQKFQDFLAGK